MAEAARESGTWTLQKGPKGLRRATEAVARFGFGAPGAALDHEPSWLAAHAGRDNLRIYVLEGPAGIAGYAPFRTDPSPLRFCLGDKVLFQRRILRLVMVGAPLVDGDDDARLVQLFRTVRGDLGPRQAVFLLGVPCESRLFRLLTTASPGRLPFHVVPHGPKYERRLIRLESDLDAYLACLGPATRQDLRRTRRKLAARAGGVIDVRRFTGPDEVDAFLQEAIEISRRTYQATLLGLGLDRFARLPAVLAFAAEKGWLRCYMLYVDDKPVAFQIGYLYGDTHYSEMVGYDPAYRKLQPGIVLHLEMIADLLTEEPAPRFFDFRFGDGLHKRRLSNVSRQEQNFWLLPSGLRGAVAAWTLRSVNWVSATGGRVLEGVRLKSGLTRWRRRRSARRAR